MSGIDLGIKDIKVVIRPEPDIKVGFYVPSAMDGDINVNVTSDPDVKVIFTAPRLSTIITGSFLSFAETSLSSSWSQTALTASYFDAAIISVATSSFAYFASASYYSVFAQTSSLALLAQNSILFNGLPTSSFIMTGSNTFNGNQIISGSLTITNITQISQLNISNQSSSMVLTGSVSTGVLGIETQIYPLINTGSFSAVVVDYVAERAGGLRTGQITAGWKNGSITFTDVSNVDIGNSGDIEFNFILVGGYASLLLVNMGGGSDIWTVQTLYHLFPRL